MEGFFLIVASPLYSTITQGKELHEDNVTSHIAHIILTVYCQGACYMHMSTRTHVTCNVHCMHKHIYIACHMHRYIHDMCMSHAHIHACHMHMPHVT